MKNQLPEAEKELLSDYVIHNIDLKQTFKEVDVILKKLGKL